MSENTALTDVAIVGGGIVGLACAWRARLQGLSVTLLERDGLGRGTSHVAAGMLAPVSEVEFGAAGRRLLELGLRSVEMWPGFVAELEKATGMEVGLLKTGTLMVARDEDEARELERQLAFRRSLGLRAERLRAIHGWCSPRCAVPARSPELPSASRPRSSRSSWIATASARSACR